MPSALSQELAVVADAVQAHAERMRGSAAKGYLVGLVGRGIARSRSPHMHEREAARVGVTCSYALLDFDRGGLADARLPDVLLAAEEEGFAGLNVTHPFKQAVIPHLTELAPEAAAIGAVNTVVFRAGRRIGHNTDCWGFAESLRRSPKPLVLDKVVLFGAGGAGAAVGYALLESGANFLDIFDLEFGRAVQLADRLSRTFGRAVVAVTDLESALRSASGAVNATPVGMDKYPGMPFDPELLAPSQWVADVIYFPAETELLRQAQWRGCRTLSGGGMAVFQAVKAFELFTGIAPDPEAMVRHFETAA